MSTPDLSALRIDERARRGPRRLGWRTLVVALALMLAGAAGLFLALREKAPEVEVAAARGQGRPCGAPERERLRHAAPARDHRRQDHRTGERDLHRRGHAGRAGPGAREAR